MPDIAFARPTEGGWLATCPTTKQQYIGSSPRYDTIGDVPCVWLVCALCDASGHIGEDCDPRERQSHLYFVEVSDG
jgi:hypothetical protein